jgi:phospholipid/cholesterol/gamma-HCH transport system substrate-binding protein
LASVKEEIKAGMIILTSLILLSGFIILIGGTQLFERLDKYYVKVMDAAGLEVGAQVKLGGVRIGRVLNISAPSGPGQPITIMIGIKQGTILYKGTQALITQVGLVGDIYLLLSLEKTTNERFLAGDTIPSEEQVQFARIMSKVEDLSKSIETLISDIDKLFSQKNIKEIEKVIENTNKTILSASSSLDQILSPLKSTMDKLELVLTEIGGFIRDNKGEVSLALRRARETIEKAGKDMEKAEDMIKAFEETAKTLSSTVNSTSKSVDTTLMSVDKTVKSVDKTVKSVDKAVDLQLQHLDRLLNLMTRTTEDLQDLIQEIKAKPWGLLYKEGKGREE